MNNMNKKKNSTCPKYSASIFNRPGVAGAVLQSPLSLINSLIISLIFSLINSVSDPLVQISFKLAEF